MPEGAATIAQLRTAIIDALYPISAYDLADVCIALGLAPPSDGEDPFSSKRRYLSRRLPALSPAELAELGRRVVEEYNGDDRSAKRLPVLGPPPSRVTSRT